MKKYKFAGVSLVHDEDGSRTPHFHITKLEGQIAVWMQVPGKVDFQFIKLPCLMEKIEAIRFCIDAPEFQTRHVNEFLIRIEAHFNPDNKKKTNERKKRKNEGIAKIRSTRKPARTPIQMINDDNAESEHIMEVEPEPEIVSENEVNPDVKEE